MLYPSAVVHFQVTAEYVHGQGDDGGVVRHHVLHGRSDARQPLHVHLLRLFQRPEAVAVQPVLPVYQVREHPCASDGGGHLLDIVQGGLEPVHRFRHLFHRCCGISRGQCALGGVERVGNRRLCGSLQGHSAAQEQKQKRPVSL